MVLVRNASASDYLAFARLYPELGPEFPLPDEADWRRGIVADAIVAEKDGQVVGYAVGAPFGSVGHISQLVVDSAARRTGIGGMLLRRLAERFRALGCEAWQLNVKRGNDAARRFYEELGFEQKSSCSWITLLPATVDRLPVDRSLRVRPVAEADDAAIERAFGFREGQMAWSRRRDGNVLHEIRMEEGGLVGVGIFDRLARFVVPLRIRAPAMLVPLLDSFDIGRNLPVRVGIEGDDALLSALTEAGGTIDLETLRLEARLPLA